MNKNSPAGGHGRPKINPGTVKRLLAFLGGKYKIRLVLVAVCLLINALASAYGSMFQQTLIDDYITPLATSANPVFAGLLKALLTVASVYLVGIIATVIYNQTMVTVAQNVLKDIRDKMFAGMQKLPLRYFDSHTHGEIMSRYTNDTDALRQMIGQSLPQLFSSGMTIIVVLTAMFIRSFWLTLVVLAVVALQLLLVKRIGGASGMYFVRQQASIGSMNSYIEEMINGQKVIKVFCHEPEAKAEFDRRNKDLCENATKANLLANILMPIMSNIGNLQYVLLAIVGGLMAAGALGSMTLGTIVSFLTLSKTFSRPLGMLSQQISSIAMAMAGAGRIFDLMDEKPETDDGYVTLVNARYDNNGELTESDEHTGIWAWREPQNDGSVIYTRLAGDVRLVDVDFSYVPEKPVLHDINIYAEPGQKVAFVGATGAGKTTITNLINRFYDIENGKISYDGIDISKIKKSDLRRSLGIVLQDVHLFTGTVMDNIRYGRLDATDEECIAAAQLANAHDFITRLPQGYDTMLDGDGANLSQGQRQLISIARCAVADPPAMILDEATSSIDTRTESLVQNGMDSLMTGRTVFVIAHRLSTVRNSDVIMVLDHGRIIERGSHEKLLAEKGTYYNLYTGAFELE